MIDVAAYIKNSFIDYPDHIASVVFTKGCNMECPYCHNQGLLKQSVLIPEEDILDHLAKRQGLLEAVVVSGGEPTLQNGLPDFLRKVKSLDYKVKLDTNGTNPMMLIELIDEKLVDYIAMDIKASKDDYLNITGINYNYVKDSIALISSFEQHEFRTTLYPKLTIKDINSILNHIDSKKFYIQKYRPNGPTDLLPYEDDEIKRLCNKLGIMYRGL